MEVDVMKTQKGDIVRFKSYSLRVESEPMLRPGKITLHGRISIDGSPLVIKHFVAGRMVKIDRNTD